MLSQRDILSSLAEQKNVLRSFGVKKLGLFGSYARNQAGPESDLDFVVEFDRKSFDAYMELKFFLEDLFQREVDLVIEDAIKPGLKRAIMDEVQYGEMDGRDGEK